MPKEKATTRKAAKGKGEKRAKKGMRHRAIRPIQSHIAADLAARPQHAQAWFVRVHVLRQRAT